MPKSICALILLAFSAAASGEGLVTNVIGYPLVTLINDTLTQMVPVVKGQRNSFMMQRVCDLARGDRTQQEVNALLEQNGIRIADIPQQDHPLSLLVNGDRPRQQEACLAFIATSLLYPPDNTFLLQQQAGSSAPAINNGQASREFEVRMAIAEATAQLYAVIANNISAEKGQSFTRYRQQIEIVARQYAPVYFQSIKIQFSKHAGSQVQIARLSQFNYAASDASGREIAWSNGVFSFRKQGVDWLSNGYILGRLYFIDVAAFALTPARAAEVPKKGRRKAGG